MVELKFKRFTLNQRIQHIIFFTSFILLAYTGFPLKFPEEWWSRWMIESVGGFDNRTFIHHFSGLAMIGVSIYHVVYHILEKPRYDIIFNLKDLEDFQQQIRYYLRYSDEHPKFGRYTWKQKFEYFGAGFGAVIMGFTGLLMWQPFEAMKYFPIGFVQIANLFHTWEAVLASIAVFIGHIYDEHFGKFPNLSWLTGNIPEEEMRHEHPVEYEEAMKSQKIVDPENMEHKENKNILIVGFAKLVFTILFFAICIWMLWISYSVLTEAVKTFMVR
ncbi:MAG: cytochrome b/b6 domain-containing protein [Candidatus Methanoperedens sp.]|nr:cytochrome b/b6 domain-containing protein [Candidatus Methanoperedens sp.]CAG1007734.1 Formate dehydrogenase, cytochrome b556(fdo) subunit [Methanosarcinales archaeon]